ncbi:MAG TPA: AI-2E family transporter, partial [Flavobacteriales bacterium]|nr:AI-2E family transporter [Flavobacteriales bacterium]
VIVPIPFFVFLLLMMKDKFREFLSHWSEDRETDAVAIVRRISALSRSYLRGVLLVMLILGTLNSIGFLALGLPYAVVMGFLLALLNLIPYIGVLLGSLLPIVVALITKDSIGYAIGALAVCLISQFLDNNFITPKVVGGSVSLNPLASMLALIAAGMLWGVVGMVVAIPLAGMVKLVCDSVPGLRPYGYLLGEETAYELDEPGQR